MLKKEFRLTKRKEFGYVYRNGNRASSAGISMVTIPTKWGHPRFGFVVTKKVGKAHTRNLLKRQMSEVVRKNIEVFNKKHNYIFVAKPNLVESDYHDIEKQIMYLIKKTNLHEKLDTQ